MLVANIPAKIVAIATFFTDFIVIILSKERIHSITKYQSMQGIFVTGICDIIKKSESFGEMMSDNVTSGNIRDNANDTDRDNEKSSEKVSVDELQSKIDELNEQLLRALAETQNVRKRAEKEKADVSKFSISAFAKDVLRIRDNLQLALNSSVENSGNIIEGIKLTMSEMDKILDCYGIKIIETLNKPFDPNFHQAMVEIEAEDKAPGIVVQVMQDGFTIYDRLLRPALVGVSKRGISQSDPADAQSKEEKQ